MTPQPVGKNIRLKKTKEFDKLLRKSDPQPPLPSQDAPYHCGNPPTKLVCHPAGDWTTGESDSHLDGIDGGDLAAARVEVLLEVRQEDSKAVHDSISDEVSHEAGEHSQPTPETSIWSLGFHLSCRSESSNK